MAVLLPLEIMTGFLGKSANYLAHLLYGSSNNMTFDSPIKAAIKPFVGGIKSLVVNILGFEGRSAGLALAILSAILIVISLALIVKTTKKIVESSRGEILEKLLSSNPYRTIALGTVLTFAVQSSSITTSLLVPLAASGLLSLEAIFPVTVGANIGTTATALLASLTGNVHGLAIALVHFLFNVFGTLIWFVPPFTRKLPLLMTNFLARMSMKKRRYGFAYVAVVFFIVPMSFSIIF